MAELRLWIVAPNAPESYDFGSELVMVVAYTSEDALKFARQLPSAGADNLCDQWPVRLACEIAEGELFYLKGA
jgi:alpha/beta superfamily hydrolase